MAHEFLNRIWDSSLENKVAITTVLCCFDEIGRGEMTATEAKTYFEVVDQAESMDFDKVLQTWLSADTTYRDELRDVLCLAEGHCKYGSIEALQARFPELTGSSVRRR